MNPLLMIDERGSLRQFQTFSFLILSSWSLRNSPSEEDIQPTEAFLPLAIDLFIFVADLIFHSAR